MENFEFVSPTEFVFGKEVENGIGKKLAAMGATKVLIHYGGSSAVKSGLLGRVQISLESAGVKTFKLGGVRPNPEVGLAREGVELCKKEGIDWVVAVGGGSVIDSAKAIANGATMDCDVWELYETMKPNPNILPIAVVLTIPASGSEASKISVLSNDEKARKASYISELLRPRIAFMNPELTYTLPPYQTAAGIVDMFSHTLERFFDASAPVTVTDGIAISVLKTIRAMGPLAMENPRDYEARANLMWAGMLSHNGLTELGRMFGDWACHDLEHEVSAYDPSITHGAGLAAITPHWMEYVYKENPKRFAYYGHEVFGLVQTGDDDYDARRAIDETRRFFASLGMPTSLSELGIGEDKIEEAIEQMVPMLQINAGEQIGSFKRLTMDDVREIYRMSV